MCISRREAIRLGAAAGIAGAAGAPPAAASAQPTALPPSQRGGDLSDAALAGSLPGFRSRFATVNGVRLHYVSIRGLIAFFG